MSSYIELLKHTRKVGSTLGFGVSPAASPSLGRTRPSPIVLTVELPRNEPELAQAAFESGADALLVRLELRPEGLDLNKALEKEGSALGKVLQLEESIRLGSQKPCGITVVGSTGWEPSSLDTLTKLGFDFVVVSAQEAPIVFLHPHAIGKVLSVDHTSTEGMLRSTTDLGVDAILLSAVRPEAVGKPMTIQDMIRLRNLARSITKPAVLPSQLSFAPSDLPILLEMGIEGLLLTSSVLGETLESLSQTIRSFREAIDKLPAHRLVERREMGNTVRLPAPPESYELIQEEPEEDEEL